jgi:hypothetical protein
LRLTPREMPGPKQKKTSRQFQAGVNGSGHVSRIAVASMRDETG